MEIVFSLLARILLIVTAIVLLVIGAGFFLGNADAIALWPWPDVRLSYVFIAAVLAAIGVSVLWIGLGGELAAVRGGALNFTVVYSVLAVSLLLFGESISEIISVKSVLTLAIISVLISMMLFLLVSNSDYNDQRPVPRSLHAFMLMVFLVLTVVGVMLITRYGAIFPWSLAPQTSVAFGCVFLGAAAYFLYGFIEPVLGNVKGQLIGLLACNVVLLAPLLQYIDRANPENQLSLIVTIALLIAGALLSLYFLLIHPGTRFGGDEDILYIDDAI